MMRPTKPIMPAKTTVSALISVARNIRSIACPFERDAEGLASSSPMLKHSVSGKKGGQDNTPHLGMATKSGWRISTSDRPPMSMGDGGKLVIGSATYLMIKERRKRRH